MKERWNRPPSLAGNRQPGHREALEWLRGQLEWERQLDLLRGQPASPPAEPQPQAA